MDFGLSEEQRLLEETLRRFLQEHAPLARVREISETDSAFDEELWRGLAELGAVGALVPESFGGAGLGLLEAALISQSLGFAAATAPFLGTSVLTPVALLTSGTSAQQAEWLPKIASGDTRFGCALTEVFSRREQSGVVLRDGRLVGKALFVVDAGAADVFLVAVGTRALVLVPREADGLQIEMLRTIDRTRRVAELVFDGVTPADEIGGRRGAPTAIGRMLDAGRVALAADVLGACDQAIARAVDYAGERKQFGRQIGSFQAVKHMCAEMVTEVEPARSLLWYAAYAFGAAPEDAHRMALLVKSHLSEVGTSVLRTATEVHGGIGFTDEGELHLWFKRVGLDRQLLGGPELLRAQVELRARAKRDRASPYL